MDGISTAPVAPANTEQLQAWDGEEGAYWAAHADQFDRGVAAYHRRLMDAAAIEGTDRVLDIGCGRGQTTHDAARQAVRGHAVGIDLSGQMLGVARDRAAREDLHNVTFEQGDAQVHPFETSGYDVAISRAGALFFGDAPAELASLQEMLRTHATPDGVLFGSAMWLVTTTVD
jgi:ubiquinone/menaquinone biosynthesis C-methylase UbiE